MAFRRPRHRRHPRHRHGRALKRIAENQLPQEFRHVAGSDFLNHSPGPGSRSKFSSTSFRPSVLASSRTSHVFPTCRAPLSIIGLRRGDRSHCDICSSATYPRLGISGNTVQSFRFCPYCAILKGRSVRGFAAPSRTRTGASSFSDEWVRRFVSENRIQNIANFCTFSKIA